MSDRREGVALRAASRLTLAPDPRAVRQARAFVRRCCEDAGVGADACEVAVLLTSETVTNAFLHGRSDARLAVTVGGGALLVEVGDDSPRPPERVRQDPAAIDGRGVMILDSVADRWGVTQDQHGKVVWFEVRTHQEQDGT